MFKKKTKNNKKCIVKNCLLTDNLGDFRSLYKIPSDQERKLQWLSVLKIPETESAKSNTYVCDRHFAASDYGTTCLKKSAVPSKDLDLHIFANMKLIEANEFNNYEFQDEIAPIEGKHFLFSNLYFFDPVYIFHIPYIMYPKQKKI